MRFHTAVNKFCFKTILRENIPIWNNAIDQYRPYLSLSDALMAIISIINKNLFDNQTYNVLSRNYTVRQILNIITDFRYNIKIKKTKSAILNQNSYKVTGKKFEKFKIKFKKNIKKDIKNTLNLIKYLY
jgi:nucleoside-diphosphate-sugar epimerase